MRTIGLLMVWAGAALTAEVPEPFKDEQGKWGYRSQEGQEVVAPTYDLAFPFSEGRAQVTPVFTLTKSKCDVGPSGFIDPTGQVVIPIHYAWANAFKEGLSLVSAGQGHQCIDHQGKTCLEIPSRFNSCVTGFSEGLVPVIQEQKDCRTSYLDHGGREVLAIGGRGGQFHEGLARVQVQEDQKDPWYGYIDHWGNWIIPPTYREARDFSEGLAAVLVKTEDQEDHWGFIDQAGTLVIPAQFNAVLDFSCGWALVHRGGTLQAIPNVPFFGWCWTNGEWLTIDQRGDLAGDLRLDPEQPVPPSAEYRMPDPPVPFQDASGKWGYRTCNGEVVVKPIYDEAAPFREGRARVNQGRKICLPGDYEPGLHGFIDRSGQVVIPLQYEYAQDFREGLSLVRMAGEGPNRFIDRWGNTCRQVPPVAGSFSGQGFSEGLAVTQTCRDREWTTEYLDHAGQVVLTIKGYGEQFHEGLAHVAVSDDHRERRYGFINHLGDWVISPIYLEVRDFSEGLAAVKVSQNKPGEASWGFVDHTGKLVIAAVFNEAWSFHDNQAWVHREGVLNERCDAPPFWTGGEWWHIDHAGDLVGQPQPDPEQP